MTSSLRSFFTRHPTTAFIWTGWTLYGVVHGALWTIGHSEPADAWHYTWLSALLVAWAWASVTPWVLKAARAFAPSRRGWGVSIAAHTAAALALAVAMTLVRREAIAVLAGVDRAPFASTFIWWVDVWLFIYVTLVVIGQALEAQRRYADRTLRANLLEAQLARTQLQYLESQLQPHFLFNALNTIQELAHESPAVAERMLQRLRALLTVSLERHGQDEVALADELAALEPYLDIQRTRFSNWLQVEVQVAPEALAVRVPHLVLQPLVENAIKHGLSVRKGPGRIVISARRAGDGLVLCVEDDGAGLREGAGPGIGLTNVMERLRQLHGSAANLVLERRVPTGTTVQLQMPWRTEPVVTGALPLAADHPDWRTGEFVAPLVERRQPAPPPAVEDTGPASPPPSMRAWLGIAGVWLMLAVLWTNQSVLLTRVEPMEETPSLWYAARAQVATSLLWLVMSLPALWLARRYRFGADNWGERLPVHVAAATACGFLHVWVLKLTHLSSAPVLSIASLNPLTGDFFIYMGLLAWSHARDFVARFRAREIETARLSARIARSRFQAMRVQLRPEFVLATLEHLERLVHTDADRAERLIARLADVLRFTLDVSRNRSTTVQHEMQLVEACLEAHRLGVRRVQLRSRVDEDARGTLVPSRLICATVDELLDNTRRFPEWELSVAIDATRVSGYTRITIRAEGEGSPRGGPEHTWWHRDVVSEREVEVADGRVSVLVPDQRTVMLMVGTEEERVTEPAVDDEVLMVL